MARDRYSTAVVGPPPPPADEGGAPPDLQPHATTSARGENVDNRNFHLLRRPRPMAPPLGRNTTPLSTGLDPARRRSASIRLVRRLAHRCHHVVTRRSRR